MEEKTFSIEQHVDELRLRIIYCLIAFGLGSVIAWQFTPAIIRFISLPVGKLVFLSVSEVFFTYLKVTLWSGFFISLPVIIYHIWKYVESALQPHEKKYVLIFLPFSFGLFLAGAGFAFFLAIPLAVRFLVGFGSGLADPMLSINEYVSFFSWLLLVFGGAFEFPLVLLFLVKIKVINSSQLSFYRRHAVLAIFVFAAVLTPTPDAFTQLLLAGPLLILYEISVFLARFVKSEAISADL